MDRQDSSPESCCKPLPVGKAVIRSLEGALDVKAETIGRSLRLELPRVTRHGVLAAEESELKLIAVNTRLSLTVKEPEGVLQDDFGEAAPDTFTWRQSCGCDG